MKLATFHADGGERIGAVVGDGLVELTDLAPDMIALIANWPSLKDKIARRVKEEAPHYVVKDVQLRAPVPKPEKVMAIGLNYADHIKESGAQTPERQIWFAKLGNAVNGPYDPIQIPKASSAIDWEAELVFVIGKRCRHVTKEEAPGVIFGYAWRQRYQRARLAVPHGAMAGGKVLRHPCADRAVDRDVGRDRRSARARHPLPRQRRDQAELQHQQSRVRLLRPDRLSEPGDDARTGDMVFTGTPGGVGQSMKPPQFLKAGDTVRIEIDKIGALDAKMIPEP